MNISNKELLSKTIKQDILMESLNKFYTDKSNLKTFLNVLDTKKGLSLRIIDWYVTNYSKKNNCNYIICKNNKKIKFNVYINYKLQLKGYSKKQFDPFCRRERIKFFYNNSKDFIITTVGQLNFFRWAIENEIIDKIKDNNENIEKDMNNSYRDSIKNNSKRKELSICATKKLTRENVRIIVKFD
uniref:Uncharacterized protein n=1 Tax=viral metagenome TaxID=1070528 RepID=A0A6C0IXE4_9ZZZZ